MFVSRKMMMSIVIVLIIIVNSGCINSVDKKSENIPDKNPSVKNILNQSLDSLIIIENLPDGYEYLGSPPTSKFNQFSQHINESKEGAYRDADNFDVYLDIIRLESESAAIEFISNYKDQYEPIITGDRFTTDYINGHDVTRIKTYSIKEGEQIPKYQLIWNNGNLVFIVRSNSNLISSSYELAKALEY